VCLLLTMMADVSRLLIQVPETTDELLMKKDIARLNREAHKFNLPATFTTWVKLSRQAVDMEKELFKKQEDRKVKAMAPWRSTASRVLGLRFPVVLFVLFFIYEATIDPFPLLQLPTDVMWPVGRPLALPNYYSGALSVVGWATMSQRFLTRVFGSFLE